MTESRQGKDRLATLPVGPIRDGIGKVRVGQMVFDVVDLPRDAQQLPAAIDWEGRRIVLKYGLPPGQRAELLAATVQQINDRLRVRFIGRVG